MTKTIFLFLKNSLFISDLLKTNYIKELAKKYRVVVFSSVPDPKIGVEHIQWKVQNPKLFSVTKFLRTACLHEFDDVSSLRSYYKSPAFLNFRRAKLARLLSWPFAKLLTVNFFEKLEMFFMGRSKIFEEYCRKYKPALIMVATPGIQVFDAEAILLGRKYGIPTLATNLSWDNLTSFKCVRFRRPDYIFVWNEVLKEAAIRIHNVSPDRVFVAGSMRFDRYFDKSYQLPSREEFLKSKGLNPKHKTILFATGGRSPSQRGFLEKILDARSRGDIEYTNILIRPHPFDVYDNYLEASKAPGVYLDKPVKEMSREDFINLKATLAYTDLNINYKSTISLESFLFDKPVINFIDPVLPFQNNAYFDETSYYHPPIR